MLMQNKLIALIILTALVGCAEYGSYDECIFKEVQKFQSTENVGTEVGKSLRRYCKTFD